MGLEAGWNCHICLRTDHSSDALTTVQGTETSQGYTSLLGSKVESLSDLVPSRWNSADTEVKCSPLSKVRCNSAPEVVLIRSANEPQRKSFTLESRRADDAAAMFSWEPVEEDDNVDLQMTLLTQTRADLPPRHRQVSERSVSVSIHESRRRSSSVHSASVSVGSAQPPTRALLVTGRPSNTDPPDSAAEDEGTRAVLEEDVARKPPGTVDDDISYIMSMRTSSNSSLSHGLGNRVRRYILTYFH